MRATISPSVVGTAHPTVEVEVERGRLRAFAHAIGETDPVYSDVDPAHAAGHPDLPVPPTFLFGVGSDMAWLGALGVDQRAVLHGSQPFTYHFVAHVGDTLRFAPRFVGTATGTYGGLHIIVDNAGYTWDTVVQKMTDEPWDDILDVHLKAPFRILRAAQPVISAAVKAERAAGAPRITRKVVNVSSVAGTAGNAGQINYSSAKAGVTGLTKTMAKEWGRYDVTVNCVAFGLIRLTEAPAGWDAGIDVDGRQIKVGVNPDLLARLETGIPLGRAGTPAEAAGAVYLFCQPESDYVSGQVVVCGGGFNG